MPTSKPFTFANDLQSDDSSCLSPAKLADKLAISMDELSRCTGIDQSILRGSPNADSVQAFLRGVLRVVENAELITLHRGRVLIWLNLPLATFREKTPLMLIAEGREGDLMTYLSCISDGFVG